MANRLKVPGTLQTRAAIEPSTFDAEKGTVEVCWTTGARGKRSSWDGYYFEELEVSTQACDLTRLNNGASVLNAHSSYDLRSVIGVVERAWIVGKEGRAKIRFSDREDVKPIRADVANGILRHISVGYVVQKYEQVEKVEEVPVLRATQWIPMELSIVPIAFDDAAQVRGRSEADYREVEVALTTQKRGVAPACTADDCQCNADDQCPNCTDGSCTCATCCTRDGACKNLPKEKRNMSETKKGETAVDPVAEAARAAARERIEDARLDAAARERVAQEAAAHERERVSAIRRIVMRHLDGPRGEALADRYVRENATVAAVNAAVLDILAGEETRDGGSHISAGDDKRDKFVRGACASIFQRAGTSRMIAGASKIAGFEDQFRGVSTDPGEFGGMTLLDLARASLELHGQNTRGLNGENLVKRALEFRLDQGFNTTSDFTILLETAVNKTFLGQYAFTPVTFRRWCAIKSVNDFRTSTFYRPGAFGKLDSLTEAGEFKHKNIPDGEKTTLTPATKGNIIGITRRAIVNDDMGVFRDLAGNLGQAAALTVEQDAWALVTSNSGLGATYDGTNPLFYSTRNNIGPTGAMSITTIDGARVVMAKQKDPKANQILNLDPVILLVPKELRGPARQLNDGKFDNTASKFEAVNYVNGQFRDIVDSAYLSAQSTTRHYLLADPGISPVFAVGFINGQEAPVMESGQSFEYDGIQWRIRLDYGTAMLDFRGAVTCAGA